MSPGSLPTSGSFGPKLSKRPSRKSTPPSTISGRPSGCTSTRLAEFYPREEVADLEGGGLRRVGAVDRVGLDRGREVLANGSGGGLGRVRRAHDLAQLGDRTVALQHHRDAGAGAHEVDQRAEERPR